MEVVVQVVNADVNPLRDPVALRDITPANQKVVCRVHYMRSKCSMPKREPANKKKDGKQKEKLSESNEKIIEMEKSINFVNESFEEARSDRKKMADVVDKIKTEVREVRNGFDEVNSLRGDCNELHDCVLDLQTRSMRDNLIFNGIEEKDDEETEEILQTFLKDKMKIESSINFDRVHRLGRKSTNSTRPRPIVAKFERYKDRENVRRSSKVLKGTNFGVSEQFPYEIVQRRKELWPKYKEAQRRGLRASLVVDKRFIDGKRWFSDSAPLDGPNDAHPYSPPNENPNKRARNFSPREYRP
ncbi:uncharacterized protein LOC121389063 [Gigantopelta aegis]|uniref:uncharacterized protein LOC121389063 n=1 Tax=Gigantopelta aegis TaxID=1735272 RepID=UPI001B88AA85|nr:uncharacterized protein LOC121389063 [Gigantopelta aegis]